MAKILIVDDETAMRQVLGNLLKTQRHEIHEANGFVSAGDALRNEGWDLVITDQRLGDGLGTDLLEVSHEIDPTLPVVMITAYASVELAVDAMRMGAFDFLSKPFMPEQVNSCVARACEHTRLLRENRHLRREIHQQAIHHEIIGRSAVMREVLDLVERVAPTDATVLITGETGTGKELIARAIHNSSRRADQPFVAVNCTALSETLLESELFGHEKGAFTGADRSRQGLFEAAHGGTLFLDEAGEMPLSLQGKLLRVLMDGMVTRVGTTQSRKVDVRVLAATHRDLEARVRGGEFREDLYYRLAVVPIHVPPLRKRMEDIPDIVEHFLQKSAEELKYPPRPISQAAIEKLMGYSFPGNVRELRNLLERACILCRGDRIEPVDLPLGSTELKLPCGGTGRPSNPWPCFMSTLNGNVDLRELVEEMEQKVISWAMDHANGVQAEAARRIGLSRSDLAYKLKKLTIRAGE